MKKTIENIQPKSWTRHGVVHTPTSEITGEYNAEIVKNQSIRLFGQKKVYAAMSDPTVKTYETTFKVGDYAEYGSYNLSYFGPIVSITEKTVTIEEKYGTNPTRHRLSLYDFAWRNYDWTYDQAAKRNSEWYD